MSEARLVSNSCHGPGLTCLTISRDGTYAYTGGPDCIGRIWRTNSEATEEPECVPDADEPITTVAAAEDCWFTGSNDAEVRRYKKHDYTFEGLVTNTQGLGVWCVAVDPRGARVVVTSEDPKIRLVGIEDIAEISLLEGGHKRGVRRATWHPTGSLLTTCGSEGTICVWDVSQEQPRLEKTIEGIIPVVIDPATPEHHHDCSALWHPSGDHFYVATRAHELVCISKDTWTKSATFSDDSVSGAITAIALSVNGVYLASAQNSEVVVWSTQTRRMLFRLAGTPSALISQMAWSSTMNILCWVDTSGHFMRYHDVVPSTLPSPTRKSAAGSTTTTAVRRQPEDTFLFGDDVDLDDGMGIDDDDFVIDDPKHRQAFEVESVGRNKTASGVKPQPPFQPGSTPMDNKKRYLAYNMLGVIEVTDIDDHHIVNVEFHDRSARKGFHIQDQNKFDLGALGERGAVFACQPEAGHPASVYYRPYATWNTKADWSYKLSKSDTQIWGVAAGGSSYQLSPERKSDELLGYGNVVVATSEGDLTFLTGTGRERRILGLGADYVSMVAGRDWVFVVHRAGPTTADGSQNLSYSMFSFEDFCVLQTGMLPIPKGHVLKWIGISEEGAPVLYDSADLVHILTKFHIRGSASWARILDTNLLERREGKDESYWPVGLFGDNLMSLILKGRQAHPGFPRPLIQELPVRLPFRRVAASAEEKAVLVAEELIERELCFMDFIRDDPGEDNTTPLGLRKTGVDKELLKLLMTVGKAGDSARAIELIKLIQHLKNIDNAVVLAERLRLPGLQEKFAFLKADRGEAEREIKYQERRRSDSPPMYSTKPKQQEYVHPVRSNPRPSLADESKPPVIHRPGLAPAIPRVKETRYTNNGRLPPPIPLDMGKRKRDESENVDEGVDSPKRRALSGEDAMMAEPAALPVLPPAAKSNPFARKSAPEKNPFARKPENRVIEKSESFFQKVDAADPDNPKAKTKWPTTSKSVKNTSLGGVARQETLFDFGVKANDKKVKLKSGANTPAPGQTLEASTPIIDAEAMEETQLVEEDTQLVDEMETQLTEENTQLSESLRVESPPPIEWPDSPSMGGAAQLGVEG